MGGWGSGRHGGRPTADASLRIDLAWMMRQGLAVEGHYRTGTLRWNCGGRSSGNIGYGCDMRDPMNANMELRFTHTSALTGERRDCKQRVCLSFTVPNLGGKRWWMHCPATHSRVAKLYCPPGGREFASRSAWKLGYQSQRVAKRVRPFERLFALQRKLGGEQGYEQFPRRPKGMWQRTYERHLARYWELDDQCALEMAGMLNLIDRRLK